MKVSISPGFSVGQGCEELLEVAEAESDLALLQQRRKQRVREALAERLEQRPACRHPSNA